MNTVFLLMAQYNGQAIVPLELVCKDYFNMSVDQFQRKTLAGEIRLPIVRLGSGQKAAKGIHLTDLAQYIDTQRAAAVRECETLNRTRD